ncbi:DUF4328 domain-containing protein [Micromonospora pisi]|uniref:DUF4328 domain-containing protein n=1 Tax=Micromonospora pisi TaxID=589240 RepID=UPI001477452D|nr:DUF4328 domain-containing protein [Micromonospora pisi]
MIGLAVVADLLIAVWTIVGGQLVQRAMRDLDPDAINVAALVSALVDLVSVVPFIAAAVLVIVWCYRARVNLDAFPGATPTLRRGWAVAGWLVPFVNLVVPARVMANIARDSLWRSDTPTLVRIWFGSWLVYLFADQGLTRSGNRDFDALPSTLYGPGDYQMYVDYYSSALVPSLLVAALSAVAGVSMVLLINRVSTAQDTRTGRGVPAAPVMPGMPVAGA